MNRRKIRSPLHSLGKLALIAASSLIVGFAIPALGNTFLQALGFYRSCKNLALKELEKAGWIITYRLIVVRGPSVEHGCCNDCQLPSAYGRSCSVMLRIASSRLECNIHPLVG